MAIGVTPTGINQLNEIDGRRLRVTSLAITGLTAASANTVPHGLPSTPKFMIYTPSALGLWGETSAPDATNLYITVGTAGATSGTAIAFY